MELVSSSHHVVYRLPDGRWLKRPRDGSAAARAEIARDYAVNRALGRRVEMVDGAMRMPHLGDPLAADDYPVAEVFGALRRLHSAPVGDPSVLLTTEDWLREVYAKVDGRLMGHPDVREWCRRTLDALGPPPSQESPGIAVSDPHPGNWVRDRLGVLQPLDFESACWADLTMPLACLAHAAVVGGRPIPAFLHHSAVGGGGGWSLTVKGVSAVSWLALDHPDDIPARIRLLEASPYFVRPGRDGTSRARV